MYSTYTTSSSISANVIARPVIGSCATERAKKACHNIYQILFFTAALIPKIFYSLLAFIEQFHLFRLPPPSMRPKRERARERERERGALFHYCLECLRSLCSNSFSLYSLEVVGSAQRSLARTGPRNCRI